MKRALWTVGAIVILGMATISCETTSNLEDVVVEDTRMDPDGDKDDVKEKPGSN
ncbi:hypothetical protein SAMN05421640_0523 [Ekhidna lutea]|uniref:Uncharacterized protein n=1 Tax=Ekhidna lutea TaxID=447679 RepID=A0A239F6R0_EKHLU|nr:hypothetical protein [Ekhidna lutea]SNS52619.1 hypothetical protein SAMN05421640_0523 [Ekhidna lutea]